ncbi:MAG: hypothetical protein H6Q77_2698 [Gemmatimonadetes bacterium]|nr:hypothetical protein [Gemmatimonadota bacterium]
MPGCSSAPCAAGWRRRGTRALLPSLILVAIAPARGDAIQDSPSPRQHYDLFHRTPAELRRPLSTDRPDRTESPYTVPAGVFQAEIDVFTYGGDASAGGEPGVQSNSFAVMPLNIKAGLLPNVDLQLVLETWAWNRQTAGGITQRQRGLGAITVRTKVNLWGNDGGRTAFAVMPFVAFVSAPGSPERVVNAGVVLPLKVDLGAGWALGTMLEVDVARAGADAPHRVAMIGSASVGRSIAGPLAFYVEGYGGTVIADASTVWEATGDVGLTLGLGHNLQLDAGLNLGLTRVAEDVNPFLGLAVRF